MFVRSEPNGHQAPEPPIVQPLGSGWARHDGYYLTPIEQRFYDALSGSPLAFSVQPFVQWDGIRYRPDFLVFRGRDAPAAVEIDGHDSHASPDQRAADARRERWLKRRGIDVVRFTGSEIRATAGGCVAELEALARVSCRSS